MRKIAVMVYDNDGDEMVDAVLEIDRTDKDEIALTVQPPHGEASTIYVQRDYNAQELRYAISVAENEKWEGDE